MMHKVSTSDMKFNTLLELTFYKVMRKGGLFDQAVDYFKKELESLKTLIKDDRLWEMNMKMPNDCFNYEYTDS